MHWLRTSSLLARLVLACFALTLGVASATPWLQTRSLTLVCTTGSASGVQWVDLAADDHPASSPAHALDCPACLPGAWPAPELRLAAHSRPPQQMTLRGPAEAPPATLARAPLPPRGPPLRG